jgi:hypothetical protein
MLKLHKSRDTVVKSVRCKPMRTVWTIGLTALIVIFGVIYCAYSGLAQFDLVYSLVAGPIVGAALFAELLAFSFLRTKFVAKAPRAARFIGKVIFGLGIIFGTYVAGLTAYLTHLNASASLIGLGAILSVAYFAAGLGIRHLVYRISGYV